MTAVILLIRQLLRQLSWLLCVCRDGLGFCHDSCYDRLSWLYVWTFVVTGCRGSIFRQYNMTPVATVCFDSLFRQLSRQFGLMSRQCVTTAVATVYFFCYDSCHYIFNIRYDSCHDSFLFLLRQPLQHSIPLSQQLSRQFLFLLWQLLAHFYFLSTQLLRHFTLSVPTSVTTISRFG
jgi:hypothetical protein